MYRDLTFGGSRYSPAEVTDPSMGQVSASDNQRSVQASLPIVVFFDLQSHLMIDTPVVMAFHSSAHFLVTLS